MFTSIAALDQATRQHIEQRIATERYTHQDVTREGPVTPGLTLIEACFLTEADSQELLNPSCRNDTR
jgi:hypothetical protein